MATTTLSTTTPTSAQPPPLTTIFNAPASCVNRFYYLTTSPMSPLISSDTLDPEFTGCQASGINYTFSPGICHQLMEIVTRSFDGTLFTDICCQSGFSWDPRGCSSSVSRKIRVFPADGTTLDTTTHTVVSNVFAIHGATTVLWGASDLSSFPADVASNRSAVIFSATRTEQTPLITPPPYSPRKSTGSGLSLPARIGIGVGVAVGVVLILIMISAWLCKVRRRRRRLPAPARHGAKELDGAQPIWKRLFGREWRAELPRDEKAAELDTVRHPAELRGLQIPAELPEAYDYLQRATADGQ
ncbi:hypothetical protein E8E14_013658 [Neopestalotiopsis sp. 37M]|nr:hypothetical protein E8E14_013658 [Neopestalotiopsis sp. 37M]